MFLCCLLSGAWHHRTPPGDPSCSSDLPSLCGKDTGVSLPSHLPVHPSIRPSTHSNMSCVSNLCQIQLMDSARNMHWPDFPSPSPAGALTPVTDSPSSPFQILLTPPGLQWPSFSIGKMLWVRLSPGSLSWGREGSVSAPCVLLECTADQQNVP